MKTTFENEGEYEAALKRIYNLLQIERTDTENQELTVLVDMVEQYEKEHYTITK